MFTGCPRRPSTLGLTQELVPKGPRLHAQLGYKRPTQSEPRLLTLLLGILSCFTWGRQK